MMLGRSSVLGGGPSSLCRRAVFPKLPSLQMQLD
jgi:hypothetical protein